MPAHSPARTSNVSLALSLCALAVGMVLLSFAAIPLYRIFCEVTGFGGTTGRAVTESSVVIDRPMDVHFNADVASGLPVRFRALSNHISFKIGEPQTIEYEVTNTSQVIQTVMATYNATPQKAGKYFIKLECFCYDPHTLEPGETRRLPVTFYIDPAIADDREMDDVSSMTLSYTFFNDTSGKK